MKKTALTVLLVVAACGDSAPSSESADDLRGPIRAPDLLGYVNWQRDQLATGLRLRFPIAAGDRKLIVPHLVLAMDHDGHTGDGACKNYDAEPLPFCYDGHNGTDYLLSGGFKQMDLRSARVVAAAGGVVESVEDGYYDRCQASILWEEGDPTEDRVTCHGEEKGSNHVVIRHDNGFKTEYHHLKKGSIPDAFKQGNIRVECGEFIGEVGSSGTSALPHLHFAVRDQGGRLIDPYEGPLSQDYGLWFEQDTDDGLPSDECNGQPDPTVGCTRSMVEDARCGLTVVMSTPQCIEDLAFAEGVCLGERASDADHCAASTVKCGTQIVTSWVDCGWETLDSLAECLERGLEGLFTCEAPATCEVPLFCEKPGTCDVPPSCPLPDSCAVPQACDLVECR